MVPTVVHYSLPVGQFFKKTEPCQFRLVQFIYIALYAHLQCVAGGRLACVTSGFASPSGTRRGNYAQSSQ